MERQAKQTDRALRNLGLTSDMVGSPKQQRQLNNLDRSYRSFGRTMDDTGGRSRRLTRDLENQDSRWQRLRRSLGETGAALAGFGKIMGLLKLPAMGVGIGVLVQAVGALAGGVIGLLPRLADLSGVVAGLGPVLTGAGLAMATLKLATNDLTKAYAGNQKALKNLTPEARRFLVTLKEYSPLLKELRTSAQRGLFGGLDTALPRLTRALPTVNTLLAGMSRTLGGLAVQAANRFTMPGFLQDLLGIGQAGTRAVGRGGTAVLNLLDGLRQLTAAAIPFTDWMTKGLVKLSEWFDRWAAFERNSGKFGAFLNRTRSSLELFGKILGNVWTWFTAIGRAARPLGDMLWRDAERATAAWSKYANSVQGQVKLTREFTMMYPAVHAIVTLFDDLVRAIFQMGTSQQLPGIAKSLTGLVPVLEHILNLLVATFGPQLAAMLTQVSQLLSTLAGGAGPLTIVLTLLTKVLGVINGLTRAIPGFGAVLSAAVSVIGVGLLARKLQTVAAGWFSVAAGANAAAVAEGRAVAAGSGMVGAGGIPMGIGRSGGAALGEAEAVGAGAAGGGLLSRIGSWGARPASTTIASTPAVMNEYGMVMQPAGRVFVASPAVEGGLGAGALMAGKAGLGRAASAVGRFALPVAAILGAYGGLTAKRSGGFGWQTEQTLGGVLNGITGGLYGKIPIGHGMNISEGLRTPGQWDDANVRSGLNTIQKGVLGMGGDNPTTLKQINEQIQLYQRYVQSWSQVARPAYQAATDQLRLQLSALRSVNQQIQTRNAQESKARASTLLGSEGQAWDIYARKLGPVEATRKTTADVLTEMAKLQEPGRRILAQQYMSWLQEESQRNPKLVDQYKLLQQQITSEYAQLGTHIQIVNGQIVEGTQSQWKSLQKAMTDPAERAREIVSKAFTDIQQKAVATLMALGVTPGVARKMVAAMEAGTDPSAVIGAPIGSINGRPVGANAVNPHALGRGDFPGTRSTSRPQAGAAVMHTTDSPAYKRAHRHAQGGRVTGGRGLFDSVAIAGNGELIVNRHTERKVNYMLGGRTTLGQMVAGETKAHFAATGGRATGLKPGINGVANTVLGQFPDLSITSTVGGEHAQNSYHYLGEAVDLGGTSSAMSRAARWIGAHLGGSLLEGIHNSGLSIKNGRSVAPSFWGSTTWGAHRNHIHLASLGGALTGIGGGATGNLNTGASGGSRAAPSFLRPNRVGQTAGFADQLGGLYAGMHGHSGAGSTGATGGGGFGSSNTANQKLAYSMMMGKWPGSEWSALKSLWMGESGFNNLARNPSSGAFGIPQALPASKMGPAAVSGDPRAQIAWGLNYIQGRYGTPSNAYATWLGRSPHWYKDGGSAVYRKPTLIGVGDNPHGEQVKVTPLNKISHVGSSGGKVELHVNIGHIVVNQEGDAAEIIQREFDALALQLEGLSISDGAEDAIR